MAKKKVIKKKVYWVDCYTNGFCYRSVTECSWEQVQALKRTAKLLGETIKYEVMRVDEYEYTF